MNSPLTDAVNPPGSVAVSVTSVTSGSDSAGLTDFQSSSASYRKNSTSTFLPLAVLTSRLICTTSTRALCSAGADAL